MRDNNYKYGRYMSVNQETRWATADEIRRAGTYVKLSDEKYPVAGLPLLSDGKEAYVDGKDTHTLIFGSTGSKKTRLFCMPMINMFARAGESFIATDPKGELYAKTSGFVKSNGYDIVVLNLRDIGKGDMWNPLSLPYELYTNGHKEEATSILNDFVSMITAPSFENTVDRFWPEMASSYALANLLLLMECGKPEEVNLGSLAVMCSSASADDLEDISKNIYKESLASVNYDGVFVGASETKRSIFVSLFSLVRIFNSQKSLTAMLTGNTVDIRSFGKKKTAVYLIIPDEKTTYHFLATAFIKQVYEILIAEAQKTENLKLGVRVNFVLDEFCNIPKIPDMPSMISAARSRNMRFFLIAQSLHQLRSKYGKDADTIKGNCDNWVFLTSKELDLLREVSELCGRVFLHDGYSRQLISVSELQRLDKEKGEALIMHARQYPIITEIADIDMYEMFKGYGAIPLDTNELPKIHYFEIKRCKREIRKHERKMPFYEGEGDGYPELSDPWEYSDDDSDSDSSSGSSTGSFLEDFLKDFDSFYDSDGSSDGDSENEAKTEDEED